MNNIFSPKTLSLEKLVCLILVMESVRTKRSVKSRKPRKSKKSGNSGGSRGFRRSTRGSELEINFVKARSSSQGAECLSSLNICTNKKEAV